MDYLRYTLSIDNKTMKKYGQSIIEYLLIAVLVILGIVIMGAYVLRSTNAHFKLWDQGVQDAFQENLIQANQNNVPFIPTNCNCTNAPLSCGLATLTSQCAGNKRAYSHTCTPNQGCDGEAASFCVYDESCCQKYYQQSCGINTLPPPTPTGSINGTGPGGNDLPSGTTCFTYASNSCYYGQMTWGTQCSTLPIACCPLSTCNASCTGVNLVSNSAVACPRSPQTEETGLLESEPISYVANSSACCTSNCSTTPCQYYCNQDAGYLPKYGANGAIVGCINTFNVAADLTGEISTTTKTKNGIKTKTSTTGCSTTIETTTISTGATTTTVTPAQGACNCSSAYQTNSNSPTITKNDCSFNICASSSNITIETATASPTDASYYSCACKNDTPGCLVSPPQCSSSFCAVPSAPCQVTFTVAT